MSLADVLRSVLLAIFVVFGAWWQFNEIRYRREVRRVQGPRKAVVIRFVRRRG